MKMLRYILPECIILYVFQTRKIGPILPSLNEFDQVWPILLVFEF